METTTKEEGKKLYFSVNGEREMENFMPKGKKAILIRALEPEYKEEGIPYKIKNMDKFSNVLELYIMDVYDPDDPENVNQFEGKCKYFTEEMAVELNEFILNNDFDEVTVHCTAGISRSSAIAMCIARILKLEDLVVKIANGLFTPNLAILSVFSKIDVRYKNGFKDSDVIYRNPGSLKPIDIEEIHDSVKDMFIDGDEDEEVKALKRVYKKRKEFIARIWGLKL